MIFLARFEGFWLWCFGFCLFFLLDSVLSFILLNSSGCAANKWRTKMLGKKFWLKERNSFFDRSSPRSLSWEWRSAGCFSPSSLCGVSKVRPPEEREHPDAGCAPPPPVSAGQQRQQHESAGLDGCSQRAEHQHRFCAGIDRWSGRFSAYATMAHYKKKKEYFWWKTQFKINLRNILEEKSTFLPKN